MEGFYRVAAATPEVRVADIRFNTDQILDMLPKIAAQDCALAVFPELCLTGYTCADLFHQSRLLDDVHDAIYELQSASFGLDVAFAIGAPLRKDNRLYNCAVLIQHGEILGAVPKSAIPNYKEFYEKRWFSPGEHVTNERIRVSESEVPFGVDLIFEADDYFKIGIELCEDLWRVIPPSSYQALAGATVIANLSASNELVAKADYRRSLVSSQSARCVAGYVYSSSGVGESTTDVVFGGHAMIAENGAILSENERFARSPDVIYADIDCERLIMTRISETSIPDEETDNCRVIPMGRLPILGELGRWINPHPFVPGNPATRDKRCKEIFSIQAAGLAKRLEHAHVKTAVIGISGGLDSTLALLVTQHAFELLGRENSDIIAVTMPGFGTSNRTYDNAVGLCKKLGTTFKEISIKEACELHFKAIDHDPEVHDVTYENVQARERTKILMNLANKHGGLVIGTGDLSEMALGWSTYNGDHMSMYAVNCSVPKTLVRYVIKWVSDQQEGLQELLEDVLDTPVSPELLPTCKDGKIAQETEKVVGPYELHDFFLYHCIKYGATPARILELARIAFTDMYDEDTIRHWLTTFMRRFFQQQFKRSCIPDGPKVGTISLSPRGDWRMPSDAVVRSWLEDIER